MLMKLSLSYRKLSFFHRGDPCIRTAVTLTGLFIAFLLLMVASLVTHGATPVRYYLCGDNPADPVGKIKDEMNNFDLTGSFTEVPGGAIGRGIEFTPGTNLVSASAATMITGTFAVEFLWKPGHKFRNNIFVQTANSIFQMSITGLPNQNLATPQILFTTNTGSPNQTRTLTVDLDGVGRKSLGWFFDGGYHHLVFKYNSATGLKQIFIDGECPAGFSETVPSGNLNTFGGGTDTWFNSTVNWVKYYGYYDNIAFYNTLVPDQQIYQHYLDFKAGNNYSFTSNASTAPVSVITGALNPLDFPAGTTLNAGAENTPCSTCPTPLQQLSSYPLPRYHIKNVQMMRNFPWINFEYVAGKGYDPIGTTPARVAEYVRLQTETYRNWNYYAMASENVQPGTDYSALGGTFLGAAVNLVKTNPTWQCASITFRAQINPDITRINLSDDHYMRNGAGQFIGLLCTVDGTKRYNPASSSRDYIADGIKMKAAMQGLTAAILPNKLRITNENAEYLPVLTVSTLNCDPRVAAAISQSGLPGYTWYGKRAYDVETSSYKSVFMNQPGLKGTAYTEYAVDGKVGPDGLPDFRIDYTAMAAMNDKINGHRYPTPDIYYRVAPNWSGWIAADHAWGWMAYSLHNQFGNKDSFYSPFITAGWDKVEENTMRPAQYLGNLKILAMSGAEFFYQAYFTLSEPFNDPKNWIWQVACASYAQAVTSRYWDCFRNGALMAGDWPQRYDALSSAPGYSFYNGDPRILTVVRKHQNKNKYAIATVLQQVTNDLGQAADEATATIIIGADTLKFKSRRQGSVYVYDKTVTPALFYQLDSWHENTHPSRWTRDFLFEAENWDTSDDSIRTRTTTGNVLRDYTASITTAGTISTAYPLRYDFQPRGVVNQTYYVWIKAATLAPGTVKLKITLDDAQPRYINITGTTQTWYHLDLSAGPVTYTGVTPTKHVLKIYQTTLGMAVDKVNLTANPATVFSN